MFNIGDLVQFKPSGIRLDHLHPDKKIGIIIQIEREELKSLWGTNGDRILVRWMPSNRNQMCASSRLKHVEG